MVNPAADPNRVRECPACGKERRLSWKAAKRIFRTKNWLHEDHAIPNDTDLVCSFCHRAFRHGASWPLKPIHDRARELAHASDSKGYHEYRELLEGGDNE